MNSPLFFTHKDVCKLLGVHSQTLLNWRRQNKLPQPYRLGARQLYWSREEILKWLDERMKENRRRNS